MDKLGKLQRFDEIVRSIFGAIDGEEIARAATALKAAIDQAARQRLQAQKASESDSAREA